MKIFIDKTDNDMLITIGSKIFTMEDLIKLYDQLYNLRLDPSEVFDNLEIDEDLEPLGKLFRAKNDATIQIEITII